MQEGGQSQHNAASWGTTNAIRKDLRRKINDLQGANSHENDENLKIAGQNVEVGITSGEVIGQGPERTVLSFPPDVVCARGKRFRGFSQVAVTGGSWGFVNEGNTIGRTFLNTVYDGQSEGGILIDGNTQNDVIIQLTVKNTGYGIKSGDHGCCGGWTGDPSVDKLDIVNCTFRNLSKKAIELVIDGGHSPNGQVAIQNCDFSDIGEEAIYIHNGQTYLVQNCRIKNVTKTGGNAAIALRTKGVMAVTNTVIEGGTGAKTGIATDSEGIISHCSISGYGASIVFGGRNAVEVDNVNASGGDLVLPRAVGNGIVNSHFKNYDARGTFLTNQDSLLTKWIDAKTTYQQFGQGNKVGIQPLDETGPSVDARNVRVTDKGAYNRVEWDAAQDPESGIVGYAVYCNGAEIGRTPYAYAEESGVIFQRPLSITSWRDSTKAGSSYQVRAINGANLFADGAGAPLRRWTPLRGKFYYAGTTEECIIEDLRFISEHKVMVTDAKGETFDAETRLANGIYPSYIVTKPGAFSKESRHGTAVVGSHRRAVVTPGAGGAIDVRHGRFYVPQPGHVHLAVYDLRGRCVAVLHDGKAKPGYTACKPPRVAAGTQVLVMTYRGERSSARLTNVKRNSRRRATPENGTKIGGGAR